MIDATRRRFLAFLGGSAATVVAVRALAGSNSAKFGGGFPAQLTPVRLPHPLPIYTEEESYLATGIGQGTVLDPALDPSLLEYTVIDDVVVPPEYERYVIVAWGDRVFPNDHDYVGYNNDYTGFVPAAGTGNAGALWINHEYVSFPFSDLFAAPNLNLTGARTTFTEVIGFDLPTTKNRELLGEAAYNTGGSALQIRRARRSRRFAVISGDKKNFRVHGLSGLAINAKRPDGDPYKEVTFWGSRKHQQGDHKYLVGTGPAAKDVFQKVNSDGLGNRIIGTGFNCSGATTPWGTIMTGEENFQGSALFFIGVQEDVKPDGTQTSYIAGTSGAEFGQVGEKYGWLTEVDPNDPKAHPKKHTALGRYRHENIALRVKRRRRLVAYMGDDRRGGHTWKFVSKGVVNDAKSKLNSRLLEDGTLYVAKYNADGTGEWIPLTLDTPTNPEAPSALASVKIAALGSVPGDGNIRLPRRNGVAGQVTDGGSFTVNFGNEGTTLAAYQGKKLKDFYPTLGAVLVDAFLAGNLVGGTPTARPEDIEVHPLTNEVFIAMTDGAPGSDGYPDSRIFSIVKLSGDVTAIQPLGALYKIIEDSDDGTGTTFRWERFLQGGEVGTSELNTVFGAGFAAVDNLAFDRQGHLWGVTDMSTGLHNGFSEGAAPAPTTIAHNTTGAVANLVGVFGNNWLFTVPTSGPKAGRVIPFAYGPTRCEMTGPTFTPSGDTLIISIQHPSEDVPINELGTLPLSRQIEMLNLSGATFFQQRNVTVGSNWPSNLNANTPFGPPRPCTIGICRLDGLEFSAFADEDL
jgi:uncharacterized protein